jgi:hypothetical protein
MQWGDYKSQWRHDVEKGVAKRWLEMRGREAKGGKLPVCCHGSLKLFIKNRGNARAFN